MVEFTILSVILLAASLVWFDRTTVERLTSACLLASICLGRLHPALGLILLAGGIAFCVLGLKASLGGALARWQR